jgi:hypothetical protein
MYELHEIHKLIVLQHIVMQEVNRLDANSTNQVKTTFM